MLLAALAEPEEARDALHAWEVDFSPRNIDYETLTVLPLLYRSLTAHGIDSPHRQQYGAAYRWSWYRNRTRFAVARQRLAALSAAGVPCLLLKGAALSALVYRDAGARAMGDVDILVPSAKVAAATDLLIEAGFTPLDNGSALGALLQFRHSLPFRHRDGMEIDLHWHVLVEDTGPGDDDGFWQRAIDFDFFGVAARTLSAEDHLLHTIAHGSWGSLNTTPLHWITDAVYLLRRFPGLDWERVVCEAESRRLSFLLQRALRYLRDAVHAPVPDAVLQELESRAVLSAERLEYWFKRQGPMRTPLGRAPHVWFVYERMCRRRAQRPTPLGYLRFLKGFACLDGRAILVRMVTWPVRQAYWMTLAAAHDLGTRRGRA